jgi:hypothetical protein
MWGVVQFFLGLLGGLVTGTSPIHATAGPTPNITIDQANGSQGGYLSSADWNTFESNAAGIPAGITYARHGAELGADCDHDTYRWHSSLVLHTDPVSCGRGLHLGRRLPGLHLRRCEQRSGQCHRRGYWFGQLHNCSSEQLERVRLEEQTDGGKGAFDGLKHRIAVAALHRICGALGAYRRNMKGLRNLIEFQKDEEAWLKRQATAFRKRSAKVGHRDPTLAGHLKHLAKRIDHTRHEIRRRVQLEDRPLHTYLAFVHPIKGHDKPKQERQLDSQFQVRLGAILRTFLPKGDKRFRGPSLRTIARLIVLFLVCADLAAEKEGEVKLIHNNHTVTVEGVLQQLRGAGIK